MLCIFASWEMEFLTIRQHEIYYCWRRDVLRLDASTRLDIATATGRYKKQTVSNKIEFILLKF